MATPRNPSMRASDAERDRVASELQEHCAQGRLTVEEFHERMEQAYAARTLGDLERLTADLPEEDLYQLPVPAGRKVVERSGPSRARTDIERALPGGMWPWLWGAWAAVSALSVALWLLLWQITGEPAFFVWLPWFAVDGVWGAAQLAAHRADHRRS